MKHRNILALLMVMGLFVCLLAGCGGSKAPEATEEPAAETTEAPAEEADASAGSDLHEYAAQGVGTFYFPEGWEMETGSVEEPLPQTYVDFTNGDISVHGVRFGTDAYEAAGVPLPADVEEYSTREGVRRGLPEDATFAYDDFGNFYTEYTEDGTVIYHVLKKGEACMGDVILTYPEGTEGVEEIPQWISQAVLE